MKKKIIVCLAALTCLAAGGGTALAYISDSAYVSNQLAFAGENGLNARLTEPSWNPRKGLLTVPGAVIPKDPQVTNTSELDMNELVALKCEFVYTDSCPDPSKKGKLLSAADMKKAVDVYQIDYNSDDPKKSDWIRFQNQKDTDPVQCFYYSRVLKRNFPGEGETTVPLFTQVSVDKSVNYARQNKVLEMGGVEIRISGHVLQQMSGEASYGLDNRRQLMKPVCSSFSKNQQERKRKNDEYKEKKLTGSRRDLVRTAFRNRHYHGLFYRECPGNKCFYNR